MKLEPLKFQDKQAITAFGAGGFRLLREDGSDERIEGGLLVTSQPPMVWACPDHVSRLEQVHIEPLLGLAGQIEFVLLGTGERMAAPPAAIRMLFRDAGIGLEFMDTRAAARVYNHLASEGRKFAAALLPIG
jgi:uncharacterized protein